ncbi:MAG: 3-methyl-2-oxobutanoate hydroxymethyltransferase [Turicibacter sp.]|nr:3-methyl-2-oxobutanoate hydroxymethyltransferase [Turicibacter sp.]
MKNTVATFKRAKKEGQRLSMLTAYDYSTAKIMDAAGMNGILVGDSLGNTVLGYKDTLPVTMEDMIHHGKAVVRGVENALVVMDMPFMSFQVSDVSALENAGRLIKETQAAAVKLEGGIEVCTRIRAITAAGIPVMAHLGLTPQSINAFGSYKARGRTQSEAQRLINDAKSIEEAGAFALVLECVPAKLAEHITKMLKIPTIGIGAGRHCDGQILVYQDMLGMYKDFTPRFVKKYANLQATMHDAFTSFCKEVEQGDFPATEHEFDISNETMERLY